MKNKTLLISLVLFVTLPTWAQKFKTYKKQVGDTTLEFVKNSTKEETHYSEKADFDYIESLAPLSSEKLVKLKPQDIRNLSLEEFNQIYARLPSGPMPKGEYSVFVMQKNSLLSALKKRIFQKVKSAEELNKIIVGLCGRSAEDCFIELLWSGKSFSEKNEMDQIRASTIINPITAGIKVATSIPASSHAIKEMDQINYDKNLFGNVLGGLQGFVNGTTPGFFPMNTFCGISQIDTRRESIITDGAFGDDFGFPYYISVRDQLITRKGLNITEEYRMIRPGLYAGRVYTNKIFLFNILIEKLGSVNMDTKNACEDSIKDI